MFAIDAKKAQIIFLLGWFSIFASILFIGWSDTWSMLVIPTMTPEFADMRTVQGALLSLSEGLDPQLNNPGDPWNRTMNYPSIWISISEILNLQNEPNFLIFLSLMVMLFLGCCYHLVRQNPSLILIMLYFSGSTLLAVERGNNDIVIFSILYIAAMSGSAFHVIGMFFAVLLKIFPILAIPAFVHSFKKLGIMIAVSIVALLILIPEMQKITSGTPTSAGLSYGSASISAAFKQFDLIIPSIYISILVLFFSLIFEQIKIIKQRIVAIDVTYREKQMFLIGSCIYIGTFIISSNWDYRLIFLLLCVPYITKINDRLLRYALYGMLLCAFNQWPLGAMLGSFGLGLNIFSKIFLFIFFSITTLIELKEKLFLILKPNIGV